MKGYLRWDVLGLFAVNSDGLIPLFLTTDDIST